MQNIAKSYVVAGVWALVTLMSAAILAGPLTTIYWSVDASPVVGILITMAIAFAAASVVAGMTWSLLSQAARIAGSAAHRMDDPSDQEGAGASLVAIR